MVRRVIQIDEEKCNGCGICADACHEGAIGIVEGKAKLLRDDYCDGLGDCLPSCPMQAIQFVEREAAAYDQEAVKAHMEKREQEAKPLPCGCPGSQAKVIERQENPAVQESAGISPVASELSQWPVQIKLVPVQAPYFAGAKLLIAADCTAYAYARFHEKFIRGHITLIGCPKLDEGDYSEKLTEIFRQNDIQSVSVVRMQVPCCGGLVNAVKAALKNSGKMIPWSVTIVSPDGSLQEM